MNDFVLTSKHFELVEEIETLFRRDLEFEVTLSIDELIDSKFQPVCIKIKDVILEKTWIVLMDKKDKLFYTEDSRQLKEFSNVKELWMFIMYLDLEKETH